MPSHKTLKSVSHNFGHSFISLINYIDGGYFEDVLLGQARKTKINRLTIDILKKQAEPTELLTEAISCSIESWCKRFPEMVEDSGSTMDFVSSAIMTIEFDLQQKIDRHGDGYIESPLFYEVVITDDREKEYKYKHEVWAGFREE